MTSDPHPSPPPYALPFVVAVSGHRDVHPADAQAVREQLYRALELIAAALPDTPIHCLSPLADGADQLFAQQVLRLRARFDDGAHGAERIRLVVPLPMAMDDYVRGQGGADPQAQAAFAARMAPGLAGADAVFVIPPPREEADMAGVAPESAPYARLARYLSLHAHVVIAVWDGQGAPPAHALRKPGGTLDLVLCRLLGFGGCGQGTVIHVPARRIPASPAAGAEGDGIGFAAIGMAGPDEAGPARMLHLSAAGRRAPRTAQWLERPGRHGLDRRWRDTIAHTEATLGDELDPVRLAVLHQVWSDGREIDTLNRLHRRDAGFGAAHARADAGRVAAYAARVQAARDSLGVGDAALLDAFSVAEAQSGRNPEYRLLAEALRARAYSDNTPEWIRRAAT